MAQPDAFDFYCEEALSGKTAVDTLYESDTVLAFHHTRPSYRTHIVIIPKEHIHDLQALEARHTGLMAELLTVARNLSRELDKEGQGVRLVTNLGRFQESPHLHFHLIEGAALR